jgi:hypothetical protein
MCVGSIADLLFVAFAIRRYRTTNSASPPAFAAERIAAQARRAALREFGYGTRLTLGDHAFFMTSVCPDPSVFRR